MRKKADIDSNDMARRMCDSDRFKLVQSHRGSGVSVSSAHAVPGAKPTRNQESHIKTDQHLEVAQGPAPTAAEKTKKEPTPHPVVPDEILEAYLDRHGHVRTRKYRKGKFLGKGGFAHCYELTCEHTGQIYAGKVVAKRSLVKPKAKEKVSTIKCSETLAYLRVNVFTSEIKIHKSLHHPQVVQFEHFFEDADNAYILLELCRNQSMSDLMRRRKRLSEREVKFYMRQLVEGLAYLHEMLVIHRDLKLGNLFLTSEMRLKIGDFGLATRLTNPEDRKRTMCGTPNYIAPEVLSGQRGDGHSFEVDIWSTGVVMYTMLVGRPPFETDDVKATYKRIRANQYDFPETAHVSRSAQSLIRGILRSDPGTRPSLEQILKHPFLNDEFVPTTMPETALLITPRSCKSQPVDDRHGNSKRFASSTGVKVPTPPAGSKRYPLKTREANTQNASNTGTSSTFGQTLPPSFKLDGSGKRRGFLSSPQKHVAASSNERLSQTRAPASSQNVLESAYKSLSRYFSLLGQARNDEHDGNRLSESASAATAAQRLEETRAEMEECGPLIPATLWISQWVDYTSKYGIGYMLSNGVSGVYFNDSTKMILSADGRIFEYIERLNCHPSGPESRVRYPLDKYDLVLKKKVTLLNHFKSYLMDARAENDEASILESQLARPLVLSSRNGSATTSEWKNNDSDRAAESMVFVKKWVKTRHAVLFQLSNETIQFIFFDNSKLMLSAKARVVSYLNRDGELAVYLCSTAILSSERPDLGKRLRYAKDMLQQMVRKPERE
ncbi:hypothetical protein PsorP6_014382 [Peronosclerospora sorghi]|uniref:Uncharacterized protein n=1 Tax=Peronosclerospora sorghi TaxID=230839 RepID=A0ACC0VHL8_9STRA|nr:hypothetical protein PsorP6_014382 [Peronosclerospora sorghi]